MTFSRWKAVLELGRASNLLTCVSNVTAGFYLGGGSIIKTPGVWLITVLLVICLYEAGMILNDLLDLRVDQVERPSRPIPSGKISVRESWFLTIACNLIGITLSAYLPPQVMFLTFLLLGLIILYNSIHQRFPLSPVILGLCRGMVYLIAASASGWKIQNSSPLLWQMVAALVFYISFVSFIARNELLESPTFFQIISVIIAGSVFLIPLGIREHLSWMPYLAALTGAMWLSFGLWRVLSGKIPPLGLVGQMLAGMSLLDGLVLALIPTFQGVLCAWLCFVGTLAWHRRVRGT